MLTETDYQNLFKYGVALTGNEDDGFELLQQALENYIRAQSSASNAPCIEKPMAYIRRSIKNLYIDRLRHHQKFQQVNYEESELEPILISEANTLEDVLITKQEFQFCWSLMSVDERELLYLSAIEGYTVQEIADDLAMKKGTLLSKLHRLKARLRTHLEQFMNDKKVV
jgi:RNA polymerase sigma-70 factor (ECF subfamily)